MNLGRWNMLFLALITAAESLPVEESNWRKVFRYRRLVGGKVSNTEEWDFVARIKYKEKRSIAWKTCSASLIGGHWALTAAHCLRDKQMKNIKPDDLMVAVGHGRVGTKPIDYFVSEVMTPTLKNRQQRGRFTMFDDDVGLIRLRDEPPSSVDRISLDTSSQKQGVGRHCKVAGWGSTKKTTMAGVLAKKYALSSELREISVSVLGFEEHCQNVNKNGKLCMGEVGADGQYHNGACIGDSGSPLVCENEQGKVLVGVTIGGSETCSPLSLIITNLKAYSAWIGNEMRPSSKESNF